MARQFRETTRDPAHVTLAPAVRRKETDTEAITSVKGALIHRI